MRATETIYREMLSAYAKRRGGQLQEDCDLSVRLWAAAAQIQALEAQAEWVKCPEPVGALLRYCITVDT